MEISFVLYAKLGARLRTLTDRVASRVLLQDRLVPMGPVSDALTGQRQMRIRLYALRVRRVRQGSMEAAADVEQERILPSLAHRVSFVRRVALG